MSTEEKAIVVRWIGRSHLVKCASPALLEHDILHHDLCGFFEIEKWRIRTVYPDGNPFPLKDTQSTKSPLKVNSQPLS